jgi:hypothetical protein
MFFDQHKNTFARKQAEIDSLKASAVADYPRLWSRIIREWQEDSLEDRAWLMYSANYLFRTNGIRWALDPLTLNRRIPEADSVEIARDLQGLSFVLLSHRHADHLDYNLIRELRNDPIQWVIPEDIFPLVIEQSGLSIGNIIIPKPSVPIHLCGMTITPFEGMHWEKQSPTSSNGIKGVPAIAYLVEVNKQRWLFPGDTRSYDPGSLLQFGNMDVIFAHVWLGRAGALLDEPPLLESFCQFFVDMDPGCLVLTHFLDFGRKADAFWDEKHAQKIAERFQQIAPKLKVIPAYIGGCVIL